MILPYLTFFFFNFNWSMNSFSFWRRRFLGFQPTGRADTAHVGAGSSTTRERPAATWFASFFKETAANVRIFYWKMFVFLVFGGSCPWDLKQNVWVRLADGPFVFGTVSHLFFFRQGFSKKPTSKDSNFRSWILLQHLSSVQRTLVGCFM